QICPFLIKNYDLIAFTFNDINLSRFRINCDASGNKQTILLRYFLAKLLYKLSCLIEDLNSIVACIRHINVSRGGMNRYTSRRIEESRFLSMISKCRYEFTSAI